MQVRTFRLSPKPLTASRFTCRISHFLTMTYKASHGLFYPPLSPLWPHLSFLSPVFTLLQPHCFLAVPHTLQARSCLRTFALAIPQSEMLFHQIATWLTPSLPPGILPKGMFYKPYLGHPIQNCKPYPQNFPWFFLALFVFLLRIHYYRICFTQSTSVFLIPSPKNVSSMNVGIYVSYLLLWL